MSLQKSKLTLQRPLVSFDLETTGLQIKTDRIVEIACIRLEPNGEQHAWVARLNPQMPIPAASTKVHGITDADVADQPTFEQLADKILTCFKDADITGFNVAKFDLPILKREFAAIGIDFPPPDSHTIDSCRIFHQQEPRNLSAALQFYCQREIKDAHTAQSDAQAALDVLLAQVDRYNDLPNTIDELAKPKKPAEWVDAEGKVQWQNNEAVLHFGKHSGKPLRLLVEQERGYLQWMLSKDFSTELQTIIRQALAGQFPNDTSPDAAAL